MHPVAPAYAELHCLSNFSFLRGASHPYELVSRARTLGYEALALTDVASVAGVVRAHEAAKETGMKLIVGSEVTLADGLKLVLLATDRTSYGRLTSLLTRGRRRVAKGGFELTRDDLDDVAGLLALLVPGATCHSADAGFVREVFCDRAWIAAELLYGYNDRARLDDLRGLAGHAGLPLVAAGDVHMHLRSRRILHDVLCAIRMGVPVHAAGKALHPNAERYLRPRLKLAHIYPPELLNETLEVAARCNFRLDSLSYEYPEEIVPAGETPTTHLRMLTEAGLRQRFPGGVPDRVRDQIDKELALIAELRYEPFFLTVYDVVKFARSRNILCQGRGSAANSAVCYCLGITEVDPARMNVLFERFISRERNEPPDIDVDFEHQRREEVIQYIYAKYGRERAALAATLITYQPRSAIRDVGKALGLEVAQVDRLAKSLSWWDRSKDLPERIAAAGFAPDSRIMQRLVRLVDTLIGFPRHLSQHVGGFVISRGPLSVLVPIENAAMPERTVIQWDKDDIEALKLIKVDVLALGMLSAIRRSLQLASTYRGRDITVAGIMAAGDDPRVFEMIGRADTMGVFQIESRAQMSMLPRLQPRAFYDLVIEVAIVRPGPIQGKMVHPYLRRRQGLEPVTYPSEEVKEALQRTLGVPIFQEQVMHLAMVAAGFTAGEADQLRRSMAAWRRKGGLEHFRSRLINGMRARGYTATFAEQIYEQICGFGGYGFPESHSASFALLTYVSSWIKHYEPAAFLAALLNSQPMGFYSPSSLVQDAQRHGVEIRPADVALSDWECTLEPGTGDEPAVRLGLLMVKGLTKTAGERVVAARSTSPFTDLDDLAGRAELERNHLSALADGNALASLAGHRRNAYWLASGVEHATALLADSPIQDELPGFAAPAEAEDIVADYRSTGLTLKRHPLALLRSRLAKMRMATAAQLREMPNGRRTRTAGLVTCRQRPGTASGVMFVTLEDETGWTNVIVWRDLVERQRAELLTSRLMGVEGILQKEGEVVHLVAKRLIDHSTMLGRLNASSRDFR